MTDTLKSIPGVSILGAHDGTLPDAVYEAIAEPADAGETIRQLREERDRMWQANLRLIRERDRITAATDPDFILAAIESVHDMDATLTDYAAAVSRAIRAAMKGPTP